MPKQVSVKAADMDYPTGNQICQHLDEVGPYTVDDLIKPFGCGFTQVWLQLPNQEQIARVTFRALPIPSGSIVAFY